MQWFRDPTRFELMRWHDWSPVYLALDEWHRQTLALGWCFTGKVMIALGKSTACDECESPCPVCGFMYTEPDGSCISCDGSYWSDAAG